MVFYFTGTGNSLYAARQFGDELVSIPQVMRGAERKFAAESIGVVTPVYGHEVPPMVRGFLRECTFETEYFYMVLTYGCRHGGAAELAKALCDECGVRVDYINTLHMVDNCLPSTWTPSTRWISTYQSSSRPSPRMLRRANAPSPPSRRRTGPRTGSICAV